MKFDSPEALQEYLDAEKIRFQKVAVVDIDGVLRGKYIDRSKLGSALKKGFGFFNGKPATAFAPFAITPDELGDAFVGGRVHLRLRTHYNGDLVGDTEAGPEMHFSFADLIQHIAKTRSFTAGTLLGSGTVSNEDRARGISCLAERRMIEIIETGSAKTPFMKSGDTVHIEMLDADGHSLFGAIDQTVA